MPAIVDFHAHVLPDWIQKLSSKIPTSGFRKNARYWLKPLTRGLHRSQIFLRHLPKEIQKPLSEVGSFLSLPGMAVESTPTDLAEAMAQASVTAAVIIAVPKIASNEFILELCKNSDVLIPAVNISFGTPAPARALRGYIKEGAKILKLHPALDGAKPDSDHYQDLLEVAAEAELPVIIHTGCIHSSFLFKNAELGEASLFKPWFKNFPSVQFILAHMNFHEPKIALDLCDEYSNVLVDTSWQPAEVIGEAVRRIGAERVLFGSDWPVIGHNMKIGIDRINDCIQSGMLTPKQAALVLGLNAARVLKRDFHGSDF